MVVLSSSFAEEIRIFAKYNSCNECYPRPCSTRCSLSIHTNWLSEGKKIYIYKRNTNFDFIFFQQLI